MIINHNMKAINSHRMMGINASGMGKSIEKLSSGLRINRAADDAAGLYISEKMRSQVRGLKQASRNSQDGISAVQTAEGALDEVHSMLQRMRELTVQGANDTNQTEDRMAIKAEIMQLTDEIQSISKKTQFNKEVLLNGDFKNKTLQVGANQNQGLKIDIQSMSADGIGLAELATEDKQSKWTTHEFAKDDNNDYSFSLTINGTTKMFNVKKGQELSTIQADLTEAFKDVVTIDASGNKLDITGNENGRLEVFLDYDKNNKTTGFKDNAGLDQTQIGGKKGEIKEYKVKVDTYENADKSIGYIDNAIKAVSEQRSKLGAIQNRLEHTIKNLDNAAENTQAAESRIRDTDMADEMSKFTKSNILTQASQAMLAQANQLPQQVLQLLR